MSFYWVIVPETKVRRVGVSALERCQGIQLQQEGADKAAR